MSHLLYNKSFTQSFAQVSQKDYLLTALSATNPNDYLVIAPTGRLTTDLERECYRRHDKPIEPPRILTLQKLVDLVYDKLFPKNKKTGISDAYRSALINEAAKNAELEFYGKTRKNSSLFTAVADRLSDIIYGLKKDGIKPKDLFNDLQSQNADISNEHKLSDVAKIYQEYQTLLGDKYIDSAGKLLDVNDQLLLLGPNVGALLDEVVGDTKYILFYHFNEFKKPEYTFLSYFSFCQVPVVIDIDYSFINGPLFGNFTEAVAEFIKFGFNSKPSAQEEISLDEKSINLEDFLRRNLFRSEVDNKKTVQSENFTIYKCGTRYDEVMTVAKRIRFLLKSNPDLELSDIAVVSRKPSLYTNLFHEIFYDNEIPVNISDRYGLKSSSVVTAVFSVLEMLRNGYKREDVHKALKNNYLDFSYDIDGERIIPDADNLNRVAEKLKIFTGSKYEGKKKWLDSIKKYSEIRDYRYNSEKDDLDSYEIRSYESDMRNLNKATQDFQHSMAKLTTLKQNLTPLQFQKYIIEEILVKLKLVENINHGAEELEIFKERSGRFDYLLIHDEIEKDIKSLNVFVELLEEHTKILSKISGDTPFPLDELFERFKSAVSSGKYQLRLRRGYGVTVTSIEQLRGLNFKVLFLCGAVDGEFPMNFKTDLFLGKELADSEQRHYSSEKMLFFEFLTSNSDALNSKTDGIYISYPTSDGDKNIIPSSFIYDLKQVIDSIPQEDCDIEKIKKEIQNGNYQLGYEWLDTITTQSELATTVANKVYFREPVVDYFKSIQFNPKNPIDDNVKQLEKLFSEVDAQNLRENTADISQVDEKYKSQTKVYSVSALDLFIACPYRFFAEKLLHQSEKETIERGMSGAERGSLLHKILYIFYTELQKNDLQAQPISIKANNPKYPSVKFVALDRNKRAEYLELLKKIAVDEFTSFSIDNPFIDFAKTELLGGDAHGFLEFWLDNELANLDKQEFRPALFELVFGGKTTSSLPAVEIGGLKFRGKIDRVELTNTAQDEIEFRIADYKSSKASTSIPSKIENIEALQLPIYMLAMQKLFEECYDIKPNPAGGLYYVFKPIYDDSKKSISSFEFYNLNYKIVKEEDFPAKINNKIIEIKTDIESGIFPITPSTDSCNFCKMNNLCRKEELKETYPRS
ncbi:MAG: PD-(D/E)XK nuclease family protein [bacterium]